MLDYHKSCKIRSQCTIKKTDNTLQKDVWFRIGKISCADSPLSVPAASWLGGKEPGRYLEEGCWYDPWLLIHQWYLQSRLNFPLVRYWMLRCTKGVSLWETFCSEICMCSVLLVRRSKTYMRKWSVWKSPFLNFRFQSISLCRSEWKYYRMLFCDCGKCLCF